MGFLSKIFGKDRLEMQDVADQNENETCDPRSSSEQCVSTDNGKNLQEKNISPFLSEDAEE